MDFLIFVLLFIIYPVLGYMAVPHTIWKGKTVIAHNLITARIRAGISMGWFIIPWWLIGKFLGRKK